MQRVAGVGVMIVRQNGNVRGRVLAGAGRVVDRDGRVVRAVHRNVDRGGGPDVELVQYNILERVHGNSALSQSLGIRVAVIESVVPVAGVAVEGERAVGPRAKGGGGRSHGEELRASEVLVVAGERGRFGTVDLALSREGVRLDDRSAVH